MKEPIICHKGVLFYMLGEMGRVDTAPERCKQKHTRVTPTHSASKTTLSRANKVIVWDLYHHVLAQIHTWMVNMCTKWPRMSLINSKTSHKTHCHVLGSCPAPHPGQAPAGSVALHSLGGWTSPEITWFSKISYTQSCTPRSEHLPILVLQMNPCNF